jgi:glucose-6-phosphate-specific signal transduction histidine kinase
MNFFKSLVNHLLKNKNFERKIKREAIHAMLNLLKTDKNVDENDYLTCYRIFVDNVNNLGPHPKSEELFFYLVLRIDQQHIKLIFKDLLNLNLDAQNLMLKSLLLEEVQGLPANFEMFVTLKIIIGQ